MKIKYVDIAFFYTLAVLALFLFYNHFENSVVNQFYYVAFKLLELILFFGYSFFLTGIRKKFCYAISFFLLVRVGWQVLEMENYRWANQPYWIDFLFLLLVVCLGFIGLINHKKWRK